MPRQIGRLVNDQPVVEVDLMQSGGRDLRLTLLADTGAGARTSPFELILKESDCLTARGRLFNTAILSGAYSGTFSVYIVRIRISALRFDEYVRSVAVHNPPHGLGGIACFRFLNRFTYGNFGDADAFGLEC